MPRSKLPTTRARAPTSETAASATLLAEQFYAHSDLPADPSDLTSLNLILTCTRNLTLESDSGIFGTSEHQNGTERNECTSLAAELSRSRLMFPAARLLCARGVHSAASPSGRGALGRKRHDLAQPRVADAISTSGVS